MTRSFPASHPILQWDIFCKVIDNFGDIGICWRLASDLARRGHCVRLWVDDASALAWMAPHGQEGVQVLAWKQPLATADLEEVHRAPPAVIIEAFGCEIAPQFVSACADIFAAGPKPVWINLEYLSAEPYAERNHALPSPISQGPAAGWQKWFFYPGFTTHTGGLLREPDLTLRQQGFDCEAWLGAQGITKGDTALVSLFCYEPPALETLLSQLGDTGLNGRPVQLLVAAGRASAAVQKLLPGTKNQYENGLQAPVHGRRMLSISYLPLLSQLDFDHLLWAGDLNFVRGEDSVIRALWAGKPFVWQIYPQDDGVHRAKLDAFLDRLDAPASLRRFHHRWNGTGAPAPIQLPRLDADLSGWQQTALKARQTQLSLPDLASRLLEFVAKKR